jgi:hypothetical protein
LLSLALPPHRRHPAEVLLVEPLLWIAAVTAQEQPVHPASLLRQEALLGRHLAMYPSCHLQEKARHQMDCLRRLLALLL